MTVDLSSASAGYGDVNIPRARHGIASHCTALYCIASSVGYLYLV